MAATHIYTCDVCGKQRAETNHWFITLPDDGHTFKGLSFYAWRTIPASSPGAAHLCGQGCAVKHLEKFLTEAK